MRTRIKICGMTRVEDVRAAADAGADAIGLNFYPPSPRFLSLEQALMLRKAVPPYVSTVAVFVNAPEDEVRRVLGAVRPDALQFHGEETPDYCEQFGTPYVKACRVKEGIDLLEYLGAFSGAAGWLLDSHVGEYGGVGERFDWSLVPAELVREQMRPLVLSGGLRRDNVREAVRRVRPWAVDVASGVESAKGIKDAAKIAAFIAEVRDADV